MLVIATALAGLALLFLLRTILRRSAAGAEAAKYPPELPGAIPIVGHLPILRGSVHIAHTVSRLADEHGPLFTLRLGTQRVVFASGRDVVAECFTANDRALADRPHASSTGRYLAYDGAAFGFSNDGPYWREMRKLVALEVLSPRRLDAMRSLRVSEIIASVKELYSGGTTVNISRWVEHLTLNIIVKTLAGKRYGGGELADKEVESFRKLIREFTFLAGQFVLSDVIPVPLLRWLDPQGHIRAMKRVSKELDNIIGNWIDEHVDSRRKGEVKVDFIHAMLDTIDDKLYNGVGVNAPPRLTVIKANVVNVILGGFDTTSVYMTWLLSLLVNHKHIQKKIQSEIDDVVGKKRWVQESDLNSLLYLQATVKEALRLYPPLPLSIPHQAVDDCRVGGYLIPKGSHLFVNLRKLHRDPSLWPEPDEFRPERFLMTNRHEFEYLPFGVGRRSCPGNTFAVNVTSLTVGRLLQGFDMSPPGSGDARQVDMEEGVGITMPRANPLHVAIKPRLPAHLYDT